MASQLDYQALNEVMTWKQTALGQKIGELESRGTDADIMKQLEVYAKRFENERPERHRVELILKIDELSGSTEYLTEMGVISMTGFLSIADSLRSKEEQMGLEKIKAHVMSRYSEMKNANRNMVFISLMYAYQDLSDTELNQYIEYMETKNGRRYNAALVSSYKKITNQYIRDMLTKLAPVFKKFKDTKGA